MEPVWNPYKTKIVWNSRKRKRERKREREKERKREREKERDSPFQCRYAARVIFQSASAVEYEVA